MKIRQVEAKMFLADRYVYDEVVVPLRNFANAPKNDFCVILL